jgi:hypothetical protein
MSFDKKLVEIEKMAYQRAYEKTIASYPESEPYLNVDDATTVEYGTSYGIIVELDEYRSCRLIEQHIVDLSIEELEMSDEAWQEYIAKYRAEEAKAMQEILARTAK